jgi:UDP-3-O-[3-hydroxymyristoyl] glucosamine N-acyltransferase
MSDASGQYTLKYLADFLGAELVGAVDPSVKITGLASLQSAGAGQLSFISRASFHKYLDVTSATAVIVNKSVDGRASKVPLLRVDNPYLAYARVSSLFDRGQNAASGIHPSAVVHQGATVAASSVIGPNVVVEAGATIGAATVIGAGTVIGANSTIGQNCLIHRNVTVYHDVVLGDRVVVHSGTVIGSDGFGFAPKPEGGWQKIHQLGSVSIGSDVEIGANTTIDRGAIEDTVIEDGVIIDNQVQIAHNVHIGKYTAIAACTGIAGSTVIGAHCTIAGAVGIVGHLTIADHVHITAMTLVTGSIDKPGSYSGGTGAATTAEWRRNAVRFNQLDEMAKRLKDLEKNR